VIDIDKLERVAERASSGPWTHYSGKLRPQFPTRINEAQDANGKAVCKWDGRGDRSERTEK